MEQSPIDEKIYSALRSLFRYHQMLENNIPDIIIKAESDILKKRMTTLSANDIYMLVTMWPSYKTEQTVITEIDDKLFEQYLNTVN